MSDVSNTSVQGCVRFGRSNQSPQATANSNSPPWKPTDSVRRLDRDALDDGLHVAGLLTAVQWRRLRRIWRL